MFRIVAMAVVIVLWGLAFPAAAQEGTVNQDKPADQALQEKLATIEAKLAELESQKAELEALKAEVEKLKGQALAAPAARGPAKESTAGEYHGFAQIEFLQNALNPTGGSPQFDVRRIFNNFTFKAGNHTKGLVTLNTTNTGVTFIQGWMQATKGDVALRAGQIPVSWGYEIQEPSSVRIPLEYARSLTTMWGGPYEVGAMLRTNPDTTHGTQATLAVINGNFMNRADNNRAKDVMVEARQHFGKANVYAAYNYGAFTTTPPVGFAPLTFPRRYWGVGGRYDGDHLRLQTEAHGGAMLGNPFIGAYGQAAWLLGGGKHQVFARYEYFEPNRNAAGDLYSGPVLGYVYHFNKRNRVTAELDLFNDQATAGSDTRFGVRWQTMW